jgi:hypothetical protein
VFLGRRVGVKKMMALVLIWLASSVVLVAFVCRFFALSGPDNPEKAIHTGYSEISAENWPHGDVLID